MSTPPRRVVQTSFGPPEPGDEENGTPGFQTTLGEEETAPTGLRITPEAYEKAYQQARQEGPSAPVRIRVPSGFFRATTEVSSPAPIRILGQQSLGEEPTTEPTPKTVRVPIIPESVTSRWHIPDGFVFRPTQQEAIDKFLLRHRGTALLPTGAGKTEVAIGIIYALKVPTLILVHSRVLLTQWVQRLATWGIDAGVFYGEAKSPSYVTVALYQSLYQHAEALSGFAFIVADEGDLASAVEWSRVLVEAEKRPYALILTATEPAENRRRRQLEASFPVLIRSSVAQQVEAGNLVQGIPHPVAIRLTAEERTAYDRIVEKMRKLARALGTSSIYEITRIANRATDPMIRNSARSYVALFAARRRLVASAANKTPALLGIVLENLNRKALLFGTLVEPLERACAAVNARIGRSYCRVLIGETRSEERDDILKQWGTGFYLLASAQVLGRGFNVPDVDMEIILSSSSSKMDAIQRLGRVLRPAPGKTHADIYVVYAENTVDEDVLSRFEEVSGIRSSRGGLPTEEGEEPS